MSKFLNVVPLQDSPRCYEDALFSVLDYIGFDLNELFSYSFKLSYRNEANTIGMKMLYFDNYYLKLLKEKFGLDIEYLLVDSFVNINRINDSIKKGFPVVVGINTYYCHWCDNYLKENDIHYVIISGISIDKKEFYIIDTYGYKTNLKLSIDDFKKGIYSFYIINKYEKKIHNKINLLEDSIKNYEDSCYINNMEMLRFDLNNKFDILNEIEKFDSFNIPLLKALQSIIIDRKQFLSFIKTITHKKLEEYNIVGGLYSLISKWQYLNVRFIKAIMRKSVINEIDNIVKIVDEILIKEKKVFFLLKSFNNDFYKIDDINKLDNKTDYININSYTNIDIGHFFNNKALSDNHDSDAMICSSGQYIYAIQEEISLLKTLTGYQYNNSFDNFTLQGQTLYLNKKVNSLIFLVTAVWSCFTEEVIINYTNGESSTHYLYIPDWCDNSKSCIWNSKAYWKDNNEEIGDMSIYTCKLNLEDKEVDNIIFSENEFVHIFGIKTR